MEVNKYLGLSIRIDRPDIRQQLNDLKSMISGNLTGMGIPTGQGDVVKQLRTAHEGVNAAVKQQANLIRDIHRNVLPLAAEIYLVKSAWDMTVGSVLEYLSTIETASLGIAASFMSQGKYIDEVTGRALEGQAALRAAQEDTKSVIKELQLANLETIATLDELIVAYQTALPVALSKGFDKQKVLDFTKAMVQAAGAIGLPMNQMAEEIRSLLTGTINPRNTRIATALGIRNEDIRQYKNDAEGLFNFLMDKLKAFQVAGIESQETWKGLWSNTADIALMVGGQVFEPLFEAIKQELKDIQTEVLAVDQATGKVTGFKPEFLESIKSIRTGVEEMIADFRRFAMLLDKVGGTLTAIPSLAMKATNYTFFLGQMGPLTSGAAKFDEWNKVFEERYKANDRALMDMAMRGEGYRRAKPEELAQLDYGTTPENAGLTKITTEYGQILYYAKELNKEQAKFKANPPKIEGAKAVKEHLGALIAAEKQILASQLAMVKGNYSLLEHEMDRYYQHGLLSAEGYYQAKRQLADENLKAEIDAEVKGYERIQQELAAARQNALARAGDRHKADPNAETFRREQSAINAEFDKKDEAAKVKHEERMTAFHNEAAKKRFDITYDELQKQSQLREQLYKHIETMAGISAQGVLNQTQFKIGQEQKLYESLYERKLIGANQYFNMMNALDRQDTDARKRKVQEDFENWNKGRTEQMSRAVEGSELETQLWREYKEKHAAAINDMDALEQGFQSRSLDRNLARRNSIRATYESLGATGAIQRSLQDLSSNYLDTGQNIQQAVGNMAQGMENALGAFFDYSSAGFLDFGNLAKSVLNEIYKELINVFIVKLLVGAFTGGLGSFFGFAKGGVFSHGNIVPFASGGLITKPVIFPMAKGAIGVAGEAGTEAIMPLTRTRSGDLGVRAQGGNPEIKINVQVINQTGTQAQVNQSVQKVSPDEYILSVVLTAARYNTGGFRDIMLGGK